MSKFSKVKQKIAGATNLTQQPPEVIFAQLKADNEPIVVESVCTNCEKNGKTTLLLINIPFFKDVVVISFCCD
jgi:zinc finger protein